MGKKTTLFKHEQRLDITGAAEQLDKIVQGLKSGKVSLSSGEGSTVVDVDGDVKFSVEVVESQKGTSLKLKIKSYTTPAGSPLSVE